MSFMSMLNMARGKEPAPGQSPAPKTAAPKPTAPKPTAQNTTALKPKPQGPALSSTPKPVHNNKPNNNKPNNNEKSNEKPNKLYHRSEPVALPATSKPVLRKPSLSTSPGPPKPVTSGVSSQSRIPRPSQPVPAKMPNKLVHPNISTANEERRPKKMSFKEMLKKAESIDRSKFEINIKTKSSKDKEEKPAPVRRRSSHELERSHLSKPEVPREPERSRLSKSEVSREPERSRGSKPEVSREPRKIHKERNVQKPQRSSATSSTGTNRESPTVAKTPKKELDANLKKGGHSARLQQEPIKPTTIKPTTTTTSTGLREPRSNMREPRSNMPEPRSNVREPRSSTREPRSNSKFREPAPAARPMPELEAKIRMKKDQKDSLRRKRRREIEEEERDLDDFVVSEEEEDDIDHHTEIWSLFNRNPRQQYMDSDDGSDMEAHGADILEEERRSAAQARQEDRLEEEKLAELARKKARKHR